MLAFYQKISNDYPIVTIEDPFVKCWDNWTKITAALGDKVQIVGQPDGEPSSSPRPSTRRPATFVAEGEPIGSITESLRAVRTRRGLGRHDLP